ncbi:unnamed protein product [Protopolystoma xenopodis]|uniref:PRMT5 TIM barrel domain-containing protein n=1 Tax=Protopolystoma xenopodis TaxID=117903 RepID=A0A3S4ZPI3_9PLAT|nr:unnamed protein product [Protopolystoma xenopodis]
MDLRNHEGDPDMRSESLEDKGKALGISNPRGLDVVLVSRSRLVLLFRHNVCTYIRLFFRISSTPNRGHQINRLRMSLLPFLLPGRIRLMNTPVWIRIPMFIKKSESAEANLSNTTSPWHWWSKFSSLCADIVPEFLALALELNEDFPEDFTEDLNRWLAEPISCFLIPTRLFVTNSKGFPVLIRPHQQLISRLLKLNVQIMITGACRHNRGYVIYQQYIAWLLKHQTAPDTYELHSRGMEDIPQVRN